MNHYRVVIFDENQKVLISKIVTADAENAITIGDRVKTLIERRGAPFTVNVTDYNPEDMSVYEFMDYLKMSLNEMSLKGPDDAR